MMDLTENLETLRNVYFVIRHGQAQSNVERLLVSDPDIGTTQYGLTDLGRQQAKDAADKFKSMLSSSIDQTLSKKLVIVSSDFKRTRETAEILHSELGVEQPIRFEIALRERVMGTFNMTHISDELRYLWLLDEIDISRSESGCETIRSILDRTLHLVQQLDKEYEDNIIILVSHGHPCQYLHLAFVKSTNSRGMQTCEIRKLN